MPKVSVVIPNYNHARFLRKRIDSVLQQTFQDFEVILLDDSSTDDSRSILSSYAGDPRVRIQFNEENSGSTFKQWNKGVRLARGEYVWIAESDDYADPRFLEHLVPVLDSRPRVVLVSCRSWRVDADGHAERYADSHSPRLAHYATGADVDGREQCQDHLVDFSGVWSASSVLFRASIYRRVGGADETLRFSGDSKTWAAMAQTGRVAFLSEPLNFHRIHIMTVTAQSEPNALLHAEHLQVVRWMLTKVTPTDAAREELNETLRSFWTPALIGRDVPLGRRYSILRDAIAIHPSEIRAIVSLALTTLRLKFSRHWRSLRSARKMT
jgi:glycosyltransferase involved in cell wall biosynthesis